MIWTQKMKIGQYVEVNDSHEKTTHFHLKL